MKDLKRLKLVQLSKDELMKKEMGQLRGGNPYVDCCGCGTDTANRNANSAGGHGYHAGGNTQCYNWYYSDGWSGSLSATC